MPQLDKFTYFTQFFWSCFFLFAFYIAICNDRYGLLGISRILKLRNQLLSHRENKIQRSDPNNLEDLLRKGFSTGVSYMEDSLLKVSERVKITYMRCLKIASFSSRKPKNRVLIRFGELSVLRRMERNILYSLMKSSNCIPFNPVWAITCRKDIMLIHATHGQRGIALSRRV